MATTQRFPASFLAGLYNWELPTFSGIILLSATTLLLLSWLNFRPKSDKKRGDGPLKKIPTVSGSLPFFGHVLSIYFNRASFLSSAARKYGGIFMIYIFGKKVVVLADRNYAPKFFAAKEDSLSLAGRLRSIYLENAFASSTGFRMQDFARVIKKTLGYLKVETVLPNIHEGAATFTKRLEAKLGSDLSKQKQLDMTKLLAQYMLEVTLKNTMGLTMSESLFEKVYTFISLVNNGSVLSYFLPNWAMDIILGWKLGKLREDIVKELLVPIIAHQEDKTLNDFPMIRLVVDEINPTTGALPTAGEVGEVFLFILYGATLEPTMVLKETLTELVAHPKTYLDVEAEVKGHLATNDFEAIISSPLINSAFYEAVRINSHIFELGRQPVDSVLFDEYDVSGVSEVVIAGELWHGDEGLFKEHEKYDPSRYSRGEGKESTKNPPIVTWGAGLHSCPGKKYAMYKMKILMALFIQKFNISFSKKVEKNFFHHMEIFENRYVPVVGLKN